MSEWQEAYLNEAFDIGSGLSKPAEDFGSGFPFLSFKEIFNNFFVPDALSELVESNEEERDKCSIKKGDIFLTRTSETVKELGMSCVALKDYEDATFNGFTKRLRTNGNFEIVPEYTGYYFRSSKFRNEVTALSSASTRASLNNEMLGRLKIILPGKIEQEGIAAVLICLDRKISNLRQQNETLESIAQTLFKHWFVDFEFPNEDGKPYRSSGGEMVRSELGEIPAGWRVGTFEEFFDLFSGGTPKTSVSEYWKGDVRWLSGKDVTSHHKNFIIETEKTISILGLNSSSTKLLPQYTTVISARGTVGNYCILSESMAISQTNFGVLAKQEEQRFYGHLLIASLIEKLKGEAYGSVFDTITTSNFKRLYILIPDLNTVNCFEDCISRTFTKILLNSKQIETLTKTRDVLLPKLMSGQLRITES